MEKQKDRSWIPMFIIGMILFVWFGGMTFIALKPPKVSEWKKVIVVSRSEIIVPCGFGSETEVSLVFSDGTTWKGYPSTAKSEQQHLLHAQKGDVECYRYNSHYFGGKQWK